MPDALSGIAVVKEGHGDMAVSNAIGSNVFDILVCLGNVCCLFTKKIISTFCLHLQQSILGLPWFLDTAIVNPDEYVKVQSKGRLKKIKIIKKFREFEIFSHHNWHGVPNSNFQIPSLWF